MCIYIYIFLNHYVVYLKLTNIVNQLYFNKKVLPKNINKHVFNKEKREWQGRCTHRDTFFS